jgi:hypothetical protein
MLPSRQFLIGVAVGAVLTATVLISVHEDPAAVVGVASGDAVGAAGRAEQGAGASPRALVAPSEGVPSASPAGELPLAGQSPTCQAREAACVAQLTTLRARVDELEQLARTDSPTPPGGSESARRRDAWLEPDREELLEMARNCKLRWDEPGLRPQASGRPSPAVMAELGMTESEAEVISDVYQEFVARSLEQLRAIYVAATGDEGGALILAPEALKQEIFDKSTRESIKQAFQRVAMERAGLTAPPPDINGMTPAERLVRFNTGLGDAYEQAVAEKLGASRARELRRQSGGWNSRHDASVGCPQ